MEVVDNTNKLSPAEGRLNLVNLLLARSFGKKVSAHWGMEDELIKLNHLELIARVRWFGMYQVLGRFQGENGRHIQIH
ncbi:MAG: hypothetical protein KKF39_06525 [Nanoarchaeota archaeon]|nr:hypothetical protein [Nanoarchaeota archaeon]